MKKKWLAIALLIGGLAQTTSLMAQEGGVVRGRGLGAAVQDRYHPAPFYAHGRRGYAAAMTNQWNQQQAAGSAWHGQYYQAQFGAPVALVVPPTAAFMSNYSWGVGNTTSLPIYHQFGRMYPGAASGGQPGAFMPTPYWPSNTNQFGVYPVRGPW